MTEPRPLAVFDLDGTLADTAHRQHFLEGSPREEWLRAHGLPEGPVRMRRDHDRRPAVRTKLEALRGLRATRTVRMLVDDDPLLLAEAERAGFTVVEADWGRTSAELRAGQEREGRT
ncbi:hypothetical protein ACFWRX_06175 [Streptomyces albidoflavus]